MKYSVWARDRPNGLAVLGVDGSLDPLRLFASTKTFIWDDFNYTGVINGVALPSFLGYTCVKDANAGTVKCVTGGAYMDGAIEATTKYNTASSTAGWHMGSYRFTAQGTKWATRIYVSGSSTSNWYCGLSQIGNNNDDPRIPDAGQLALYFEHGSGRLGNGNIWVKLYQAGVVAATYDTGIAGNSGPIFNLSFELAATNVINCLINGTRVYQATGLQWLDALKGFWMCDNLNQIVPTNEQTIKADYVFYTGDRNAPLSSA